jgi:hypothetical protein
MFNLHLGNQNYEQRIWGIQTDWLLLAIALLATFISAIIATFKFSKNIETLRYAITKFSKLIRTIEKVVNMDRSRRPDADAFLDLVSEKYYKYHTSNNLLVEEMMNYRNIRERVNVATNYNDLSPHLVRQIMKQERKAEEDQDIFSNIFLQPLGLIRGLIQKNRNENISKTENSEEEELAEITIDVKDIEDHDFIKEDYVPKH